MVGVQKPGAQCSGRIRQIPFGGRLRLCHRTHLVLLHTVQGGTGRRGPRLAGSTSAGGSGGGGGRGHGHARPSGQGGEERVQDRHGQLHEEQMGQERRGQPRRPQGPGRGVRRDPGAAQGPRGRPRGRRRHPRRPAAEPPQTPQTHFASDAQILCGGEGRRLRPQAREEGGGSDQGHARFWSVEEHSLQTLQFPHGRREGGGRIPPSPPQGPCGVSQDSHADGLRGDAHEQVGRELLLEF